MTETRSRKPSIKMRTVVSLATAWMFLVMGITGCVLFIVPQGRIAYWVDWRFLGLSKTDWGDIHILSCVLFLIAGGWHLYFNWKAFLGHLRSKLATGLRIRRELVITTIIFILVVASAYWRLPPLGYLIDLNEHVKSSWIESEEFEPPFGHAELLSLMKFCAKTNIDLNRARAELERQGLKVESDSQTLAEIAEANSVSPKDLFAAIRKFQLTPKFPTKSRLTADDVLERYEGTGLGKKTVAEECAVGGEEISRCLKRLENRGVQADPDEKIREVALRAGKRPIQIVQEMLVDP